MQLDNIRVSRKLWGAFLGLMICMLVLSGTAQNRIVLLTDGAANLGNADPERLAAAIETLRSQRIAFDACGVGLEGIDDDMLEALTRKGDGLTTTVPVDLYSAILGGDVSVDTLGKPVRLTIPEGTDSGKTLRLKGLGMPRLKKPGEFGDLYARIEVHLPNHLTEAEKEKFREIRNMRHA